MRDFLGFGGATFTQGRFAPDAPSRVAVCHAMTADVHLARRCEKIAAVAAISDRRVLDSIRSTLIEPRYKRLSQFFHSFPGVGAHGGAPQGRFISPRTTEAWLQRELGGMKPQLQLLPAAVPSLAA